MEELDHKKLQKTLKGMFRETAPVGWDIHWDVHRTDTMPSSPTGRLGSPEGDARKQPISELLDSMSYTKRQHKMSTLRLTQDRTDAEERVKRKAMLRFPCVYPHENMWDISSHTAEPPRAQSSAASAAAASFSPARSSTQKLIRRPPDNEVGGGGQGVFLFRQAMTADGRLDPENHLETWMPTEYFGKHFGEPPLTSMSVEALQRLIKQLQTVVDNIQYEHTCIRGSTVRMSTFKASIGSDLDDMRKRQQRVQDQLKKSIAELRRRSGSSGAPPPGRARTAGAPVR